MADGIPPLQDASALPPDPEPAMTADGPGVANSVAWKWGIFAHGTGEMLLAPDSFMSLDFHNESRISQYPQEQGAFLSYNKVASPYEIRLALTKGGGVEDRQAFLTSLDAHAGSTELFDIVTPERTYIKCNISRNRYARAARQGATLLTAEIGVTEIRETATAVLSSSGAIPVTTANPTTPGANDPSHAGLVQAVAKVPFLSADKLTNSDLDQLSHLFPMLNASPLGAAGKYATVP